MLLLGSGCFWGREYHLRQLPGVLSTSVGFAGGTVPSPTYEQVCEKATGHAEVVRVAFDVRKLPVRELLIEFLELHDFGHDRRAGGGQYRSAVYALAEDTHARELLAEVAVLLTSLRARGLTVVTEVRTVESFYPAAGRHQQYCTTRGLQPKRRAEVDIRVLLTAL